MAARKARINQVIEALDSVDRSSARAPDQALDAIAPLRGIKPPGIHEVCEKAVRAGDFDKAKTVLVAARDQSRLVQLVIAAAIVLVPLVIGSFIAYPWISGFFAKATITNPGPACARDIRHALEAFKNENGLGFEIVERDAEPILAGDSLEKRYSRDGATYAWHFRVHRKDDACKLVNYKRKVRKPGESYTTSGGDAPLPACECE